MNQKNIYKTSQKKVVLDYLESHPNIHVSANEIYQALKAEGVRIGLTTVYRHLDKLAQDGIVVKSIVDENTPACFEYTGHSHHHNEQVCYHCKCIGCGKLIHLHCDEVQKLEEHINHEHGFKIMPSRTVFFGLCEACQETRDIK